MTADTNEQLVGHLLRADLQEDICLVLWRPSTGDTRTTHLLVEVVPPLPNDRQVHGNATVTGTYVLRAATHAAERGCGIALAHSHPMGSGHQQMSGADFDAERSYAALASEVTGFPLVGLTLAGDRAWSARTWTDASLRRFGPVDVESVRVLAGHLAITWNPLLRPAPRAEGTQLRTVAAWGDLAQADLARRRICVVGAGSIGLDVILRLAATGVVSMVVIDPDIVKLHNLDRLIGATDDAERQVLHRLVALDREGLLDDPVYLASAAVSGGHDSAGQNVAALSVGATALLLSLYVSFSVAPGGFGEPGPLQYNLATHDLDLLRPAANPDCAYEAELCA